MPARAKIGCCFRAFVYLHRINSALRKRLYSFIKFYYRKLSKLTSYIKLLALGERRETELGREEWENLDVSRVFRYLVADLLIYTAVLGLFTYSQYNRLEA